MKLDDTLEFNRDTGRTLLLACGALVNEIIALIEANGLSHLEVQCLPAQWHHTPKKIPEAIRNKIRANKKKYQKIYVIYGDCGTAGALDQVLQEEGGIERIPGPHCFSFYWGNEAFCALGDDDITTFYLTDFFCRFFEKFIWKAFGIDRHEEMVDLVFGHYERLVYMPQTKDAELELKAQKIAAKLKLSYQYHFAGYGDLGAAINQA